MENKSGIRVRAVIEKDGKFLVCKHKDEGKKYNIPAKVIDNEIKKIIFDMENPFLK